MWENRFPYSVIQIKAFHSLSSTVTIINVMEKIIADKFKEKGFVPIPEASQSGKFSAATKLLRCRQQLAELDEALQIKKEEFKVKMAGLESRRLAFKMKEQQLQSHLAKFDYYIRENDMKSVRAMKKAQVEKSLGNDKAHELAMHLMSLTDFIDKRDQLKGRLDKHLIYFQYLEQVLKHSEEFSEVRDVVSRYETLKQTHQELYEKEETSLAATESERQKLTRYVTRKDAEILSLTNRLSEMQLELERLLAKSERLDNQVAHIENTAANKTLELGRIRMATHAMFHLMVKQSARMSAQSYGDITDPIDQLDMICTYIVDLTMILEDIKKAPNNPQSSTTIRRLALLGCE